MYKRQIITWCPFASPPPAGSGGGGGGLAKGHQVMIDMCPADQLPPAAAAAALSDAIEREQWDEVERLCLVDAPPDERPGAGAPRALRPAARGGNGGPAVAELEAIAARLRAQTDATRANLDALERKVADVAAASTARIEQAVARRPELRAQLDRARSVAPDQLPPPPPSAAARRRQRERGSAGAPEFGAAGAATRASLAWS